MQVKSTLNHSYYSNHHPFIIGGKTNTLVPFSTLNNLLLIWLIILEIRDILSTSIVKLTNFKNNIFNPISLMKVSVITQASRIIQVPSLNFHLTKPNRKEQGRNIKIYIIRHFFLLNYKMKVLRIALRTIHKITIDWEAQFNMVQWIVTIRISSSIVDLTLDKLKTTFSVKYTKIGSKLNRMIDDWAVPGS